MMRNSFLPLMAFMAVLSTGCTKTEIDNYEEYNPTAPVSFITTNATNDDMDDTGAATRGTPIDDVSDLVDMGVFASHTGTTDWSNSDTLDKMFNQKLYYNAGKWNYLSTDGGGSEEVYWGATTLIDRYSFFAYAPYETGDYDGTGNPTGNGIEVNETVITGVPKLTYTVPVLVENQPDLMVATTKNVRPTGAKVALEMKHALTSVGFQIKGNGEKVKGISIQGVRMSGTLAVDGENITWSSLGATTTTDFSASLNSTLFTAGQNYYTTTPTMTDLIAGNGYLMMIPQTLENGAKVIITFDDDTTREIALNIDTWEPGKIVTYNVSIPVGGVLAPPGVIGYIRGTNTLTLKGSREYAANAEIKEYADLRFGGLENATVYVAYFRFGSLVALSSDPTDTSASGTPFESEDIIAGPTEYATDLATLKTNPVWNNIPVYTITDYNSENSGVYTKRNVSHPDYHNTENFKHGKGDPCMYYFNNKYGGGWMLPTGSPSSNPYNGAPGYAISNMTWKDAGALGLGAGLPAGHLSGRTNETGWFYPATGYRYTSSGEVDRQGTEGNYWSSTAYDISFGGILHFDNDNINPSTSSKYAYGFSVRCIGDQSSLFVIPSSYSFPVGGGTEEFDVKKYNISEAVQISGGASWLTYDLNGDILTVTAAKNEDNSNDARSATITLAVPAGPSATLTITQEPAPPVGVLAPPGVIGYIKGTYTLTLKGSQEYADLRYDQDKDGKSDIEEYADANFGGLENETVYIAYFRFGSLVALSSDPRDTGETPLLSNDVIAGPSEWPGYAAYKANPFWHRSPGYSITDYNNSLTDISSSGYNTPAYNALGKGDPCIYYFPGGGWKLPPYIGTGGSSPSYNGRDNAAGLDRYRTSNMTYVDASGDLPAGWLSNRRESERGMFFPTKGTRSTSTGKISTTYGQYWSSMGTIIVDSKTGGTVSGGYYMRVGPNNVDPNNIYDFGIAQAVRCVAGSPVLSVSPATVSVPYSTSMGNTSTVTTNVAGGWTASTTDTSWITLTKSSGKTGEAVTFSVTANPTISRTGSITVSAGTAPPVTITVTQAVDPAPALTVSENSLSVPATTSMGNSSTVMTNVAGGWTATTTDTSWITLTKSTGTTGEAVTFSVTQANPLTTARTGTITVSAGSATPVTITVTQAAPAPAPIGSAETLAPPGVIGYIKGTNTLTLRGSKEYINATVDTDGNGKNDIVDYAETIDPRGLENETVYIAYFKFGSLVAISSDPTDNNSPYLEPEDIVAAPDEWKGSLQGARDFIGTTWANIPAYNSTDYAIAWEKNASDPSYHNSTNFALGKGDPCMYYFGSGGWRLPTGNPYNTSSPATYSTSNLVWKAANALGTGLPAGRLSTRAGESGWFYPVAGYRLNSNGDVYAQGSSVSLWSSTTNNGAYGYSMNLSRTSVNTSSYGNVSITGFSIRCVR
jgi:hypothetical protein